MHAITCSGSGGPDVMQWREVSTPQPSACEVLIKVAAAGLNRADILQRQGKYPPPSGASEILGMEVAGEVVALGAGASRWEIGDKVCALLAGGGYAEYVVAPEGQCLPIPIGLSMQEAATLPEAVATVWANLFEAGGFRPNTAALVHGGSSGIGTTAIQMAKLSGGRIYVTVRNQEKVEACLKLGADAAINYTTDDFVDAVLEKTGGHGVEVVLDMVGGDYVNRNLAVLAPHGRHVSIATQQGKIAPLDIGLVMRKQLWVTGSTLRGRLAEEKARLMREVEEKPWKWVTEGRLKPLIFRSYPIKNAAEAHKMMESGEHIGKMVLETSC